jgi:hypothetical protein
MIERPGNLVAGAGVEPAHARLMKPLPSHLAPPRFRKVARRVSAALTRQGFGVLAAQAGARRVVSVKMVRPAGIAPASPDWHSGILLLNDSREIIVSGAGGDWLHTRAANDKKNKHLCKLVWFAPAGKFHGGSFGVSGTPPVCITYRSCEASGLEKSGARNQTIQGP